MNRTEIIAVNYEIYNQFPLIETALRIFLIHTNVHDRPINVNFYLLIFPINFMRRIPGRRRRNRTTPSWTPFTSTNADLSKQD